MNLRPYQQRAIDQLYDWMRGNEGNPIVDACVAAGKSVLLAHLCQDAIKQWPDTRIVMLVPSKELLEQNYSKLMAVWPDAPVGIMSASVGRKEIRQITIATIGSIHKKAHELGQVHLVLVDECHLINNDDAGMYRDFIAKLQGYCPDLRVIGWTGTPYRGNGVWLTAAEKPMFHDIATRITMDELLAEGFLTPLTTMPTLTQFDASGVRTVGGDYVVSDLARAIDRPELVRAACVEAIHLASDRQKWLVYCVTVEHARHVALEMQANGIACDIVTGNTPKAERAAIIERFRRGELRALVSVAVLTTGFDVPDVDCIILLRNTQSPVLYVQIMGRGMRIADGKTDCLVLDFTDTVELLGPVNKVKGRLPSKTSGEAPVKVCGQCGTLNPISAATCKMCGAPFPVEDTAPHSTQASTALVLDIGKPRLVRYEITDVRYAVHHKPGKLDSLRVEYWSGLRRVASEWVCLNHVGYAKSKAEAWCRQRGLISDGVVPTVSEAMQWLDLITPAEPTAITVNESAKYPEIVRFEWEKKAA